MNQFYRFFDIAKRYTGYALSKDFRVNAQKWKSLKGKYKGKRVFLIGNGPSLNKTPLYLLKDEYTLCFNRFDLMLERFCWTPSFYAMADTTVIEDNIETIKQMSLLSDYAFLLNSEVSYRLFGKQRNTLFYYGWSGGFSKRLPFVKGGSTVTIEGLQVLNYLGFNEIYMIGVDMNYVIDTKATLLEKMSNGIETVQSTTDDDPNHFDPRYFGKGAKFSQPNENTMTLMLKALDNISLWFKNKTSTRVVNAGYDSKVESFKRCDFVEALKYDKTKIDELFTEVIQKYDYDTIESFRASCTLCSDFSDWDDSKALISMRTQDALSIIKKKILTYIPVGPFDGNIYFIKRK